MSRALSLSLPLSLSLSLSLSLPLPLPLSLSFSLSPSLLSLSLSLSVVWRLSSDLFDCLRCVWGEHSRHEGPLPLRWSPDQIQHSRTNGDTLMKSCRLWWILSLSASGFSSSSFSSTAGACCYGSPVGFKANKAPRFALRAPHHLTGPVVLKLDSKNQLFQLMGIKMTGK